MVQIGDVPATQETHPDWPRAPGSHIDRLRHVWFWRGGGKQRPSCSKVGVGHSEGCPSTWVTVLSRGAASDAHGSIGKPEPAFQSAESTLPVQNRTISGACAVLAPTRCYAESWCAFQAMLGRLHTVNCPVVYRSAVLGRTVLAPPGMAARAQGERCSGYIGTPRPRRGPRRLDQPVSRTQCK